MSSADPIADMLAAIKNANEKFKEKADVPYSRVKTEIARVFKEEGYISAYKVIKDKNKAGVLRILLKYTTDRQRIIQGVKRVSTPGLRVYRGIEEIPRVQGGLGTVIVSTSKGIMTGRQSQKSGMGGEVLCTVW